MTTAPRSGGKPFTLRRTLDAPRATVWKAWTDRDELLKWFGAPGCPLASATMDLRPGGVFHYCMRTPDGREMWGKWTFREVAAPERLVLISTFSDAQGGVTRHPMAPTWPRETLSTTVLTERGGRTELELTASPYDATPEEQATFDGARAGMEQGWSGTFAQLTAYLAK